MHNRDPVAPKVIKKVCDTCGQHFVNNSNFFRYQKQVHKVAASDEELTRNARIKCSIDSCTKHFRNYHALREHLTSVHEVELEYNEFQFESLSGMFLSLCIKIINLALIPYVYVFM